MEEKQHAGMRRGVFQSCMAPQMVEGKPTWWWSTNGDMRPPPQPSSSSSSSSYRSSSSSWVCPQFSRPSNIPMTSWQDGQCIPESWCQLLFGGFVGEEEKHGLMMPLQTMTREQQVYPSAPAQIADTEQELFGRGYVHMNEEIDASKSTWSQVVPASSPSSCITTSFSTNVSTTFSSKADQLPDTSSECNSIETAPAFKKARLEGSSSPKSNPKVRKEKLGERITALHQIVSPFGKTDTASVLLEAIGYIRFLHSQIEVLSSSYLPAASGDLSQPILNENGMKNSGERDQECNDEQKKDLRSRGLCLVPVAFMMHVGREW